MAAQNISGTGMDTNIIGRMYQFGSPEPAVPNIGIIAVHGITPESHGNACGMGLADCVPKSFFDELDFGATSTNIITSNNLERGKLPVVCGTDAETWGVAVRASGTTIEDVRAIRVANTLTVAECWVSAALIPEVQAMAHIKIVEEGLLLLTAEGHLTPFERSVESAQKKQKV